jgi:large subunit ribosomal protein L9
MELVLLEKVQNLGDLGDVVSVRPGYARNYLIPGQIAKPATAENIAIFEERRVELEAMAAEKLSISEKRRDALDGQSISLTYRASDEGKLFGSVSVGDIVDSMKTSGLEVNKNEVQLPNGPIRVVGEHEVRIILHGDIGATVSVVVDAQI